MTILVTGGAGFIGSNFIYYMQQKHPKWRLVCLDALTYAGNQGNLASVLPSPTFRFVKGDIADEYIVEQVFCWEHPDMVVNFAAESHVDRSIEDAGAFLHTNVEGVRVLLEACRRHGNVRFHQISTDEVYGQLPLDRPDLRFTESSPLCPSSPYSASKAAADLLCMAYFRTYGLPVTISRCTNNFGPRQFPEKLLPKAILSVMSNTPIPLYGDGSQVRDWIFVDDHCAAVDLILRNGEPGQIYNVGAQVERTNLQFLQTVLTMMDAPLELIQPAPDRPGHDVRYALDASLIRAQLGWAPQTDFQEGLSFTIYWYREHECYVYDLITGRYREYDFFYPY